VHASVNGMIALRVEGFRGVALVLKPSTSKPLARLPYASTIYKQIKPSACRSDINHLLSACVCC